MEDDPDSIKQIRKCGKGLECVYESYEDIQNPSAKCMERSFFGNISLNIYNFDIIFNR